MGFAGRQLTHQPVMNKGVKIASAGVTHSESGTIGVLIISDMIRIASSG